jgi:hypothetical protein
VDGIKFIGNYFYIFLGNLKSFVYIICKNIDLRLIKIFNYWYYNLQKLNDGKSNV